MYIYNFQPVEKLFTKKQLNETKTKHFCENAECLVLETENFGSRRQYIIVINRVMNKTCVVEKISHNKIFRIYRGGNRENAIGIARRPGVSQVPHYERRRRLPMNTIGSVVMEEFNLSSHSKQ